MNALKGLLKKEDPIIQKADKGNTVVIWTEKTVCKLKPILNDRSKFQKVYIDQNKVLNNPIHMENWMMNIIKKLRDKKRNLFLII